MNNDKVIEMAEASGMQLVWDATVPGLNKMKVICDFTQVADLVSRVEAAEREACAKVCEDEICACCWDDDAQAAAEHLAAVIRARGNT